MRRMWQLRGCYRRKGQMRGVWCPPDELCEPRNERTNMNCKKCGSPFATLRFPGGPICDNCLSFYGGASESETGLQPVSPSATRPLTLTISEIRDLAGMCGLVVNDATAKEKEDERETEITITPWPAGGIKDENGQPYGMTHKHLA